MTVRAVSLLIRGGLLGVAAVVGGADPAAVVLLVGAVLASLVARLAPPWEELAFTAGLAALIALSAVGALPDRLGGDLVMHVIASALLALVLLRGVLARARRATGRDALLAGVLVGLVGVLWEIAEATSDARLGTHMSLGAVDTATDLLADLTGAAAVALLAVGVRGAGVAA